MSHPESPRNNLHRAKTRTPRTVPVQGEAVITTKAATKRLLDLFLSSTAIILSIPLVVIIVISILLFLGRPVLFLQTRAGVHGRSFRLYKFRTMKYLTDADGKPADDDFRLGHFGRLLRRTSLDELPQLLNVLKGDMSLVGPRPLPLEYVPLYTQDQRRRLAIRPGLTGWAQIHGRNTLTWEQKFSYDVWYVDHWTLGLDWRIIGITVVRIVSGQGVSQAGHATAPRFTGTREDSSDVPR